MTTDKSTEPTTGLNRWVDAWGYSLAGLRHAALHEIAFRQEVLACLALVPLAIALPAGRLERLVLVMSMMFVVVVELVNSAIESTVDRISLTRHPLSGQAKDLGSAAVTVALLMSFLCWVVIAGPVFAGWASAFVRGT